MSRENEERRRPDPAAAPADNPPRACKGYGACSKSGCNCQGFEGSGGTCANSGCGHADSDHW